MANLIPTMQQIRTKQIDQFLGLIALKINEAVATNKTIVLWPLPFSQYSSLVKDILEVLKEKGYTKVGVRNECLKKCDESCYCNNHCLYIELE